MLLHEFITSDPPDGSYDWEKCIACQACFLWSEGREGSTDLHEHGIGETNPRDVIECRMGWSDFAVEEAPGWRMLSSLPSCPNPHMRFPTSREMLRRIQNNGAEL